MLNRPASAEYPPYFQGYIDKVPEGNVKEFLVEQMRNFGDIILSFNEDQLDYRYAEDKWSIREVLIHLVDVERVFAFRALAILRGEKNNIQGFDHNDYVANIDGEDRTSKSIYDEFLYLRQSNVHLFNSIKDDLWTRTSLINDNVTSARAIVFMMVGHIIHHLNILEERYL